MEPSQSFVELCRISFVEFCRITMLWLNGMNGLVLLLTATLIATLWLRDANKSATRRGFDKEMRRHVLLPLIIGFAAWTTDYLMRWLSVETLAAVMALGPSALVREMQPEATGTLKILHELIAWTEIVTFGWAGWVLLGRKNRVYGPLNQFLPMPLDEKGASTWRRAKVVTHVLVIWAGASIVILLIALGSDTKLSATELQKLYYLTAVTLLSVLSLGIFGAGLLRALNFRSWNLYTELPGSLILLYAAFQYIQLWGSYERVTIATGPTLLVAFLFKLMLFATLTQVVFTMYKLQKESERRVIAPTQSVNRIGAVLQDACREVLSSTWHEDKSPLFSDKYHTCDKWTQAELAMSHTNMASLLGNVYRTLPQFGFRVTELPPDCSNNNTKACWHLRALKALSRCNFETPHTSFLVPHLFSLIGINILEGDHECSRCGLYDQQIDASIEPAQFLWALSTLTANESARLAFHEHLEQDDVLGLKFEFPIRDAGRFVHAASGTAPHANGRLSLAGFILRDFLVSGENGVKVIPDGERLRGLVRYAIPTRLLEVP